MLVTAADLPIRLLLPDDLEQALALSTVSGWNQRIDDWRMLLRLAPHASFAAVAGERVVGTAIGIDYGGFGWVAMMLVEPAYRGRGLGARLLQSALRALPATLPVRLDATPLGRPLYLRHGFLDEARLTRHVRDSTSNAGNGGREPTGVEVRKLSRADLAVVSDADAQVFGGDRRPVLEWMLADAPELAWIARQRSGTPQYCFGRRGRIFGQIGPIAAASPAVARALAEAALHAAGSGRLAVDAFDGHPDLTSWLQDRGFAAARPLFRMCRPAAGREYRPFSHPGCTEFAILGPEFA